MSDFLEHALRRQSCRAFADKAVEHDKLVKCVTAGGLAPSACNSQPWSFVIAETPDKVKAVAECGQSLNGNNPFLSGAGAFIIVLEEYARLMPAISGFIDSQTFADRDAGGAVSYVCLEAESLGLGTCIIGLYDRPALYKLLNIPEGKRFAAFIAVGYPQSDKIRPKVRKPLDEIARFV
jgi:nitroreductase